MFLVFTNNNSLFSALDELFICCSSNPHIEKSIQYNAKFYKFTYVHDVKSAHRSKPCLLSIVKYIHGRINKFGCWQLQTSKQTTEDKTSSSVPAGNENNNSLD